MPTFQQWDPRAFKAIGPVELTKSNVSSIEGATCRVALGNPSPKTFRPMSLVTLASGEQMTVDVPAGELKDRLNDAEAESPDVSLFNGIEEADSSPDEEEETA